MMKHIIISSLLLAGAMQVNAQSYPHYTMFMFNKLLYNPAYAGNKDLTAVNGYYRNQWTGINGAPQTITATIDGPVGSYMKPFRSVALGLSVTNEKAGITNNTSFMGYYAYRVNLQSSVLSFGLQAGVSSYTANYSQSNPYDANDKSLTRDVKNALLPNAGAGVYWSGKSFYISAAVPNLLQNYYDKDNKIDNRSSRQTRSYYVGGGYVFSISEDVKLEPQALIRYAGNGMYSLPVNADINLSAILFDRLLVGVTYRTDKSVEGLVHMQVTKNINIGYSYDYTLSGLNPYNDGSHEITIGFDFIKDRYKYTNPRFIKMF
jgi:type IX secretion system PorP/SprF family membrane protein